MDDTNKKLPSKDFGLVYEDATDGKQVFYKSYYTVDEIADALLNDEELKTIKKKSITIIQLYKYKETYENYY